MPVHLIGAMLVRRIERAPDGSVHLIHPADVLTIAASERERLRESGKEFLYGPFPDREVYLAFAGGEAREYTLTSLLVYPGGIKVERLPWIERFDWPPGAPVLELYEKFQGELAFKDSGIYELRFLLDGEPLVGLKWPIIWEDEVNEWRAR